MDYSFQHYRIQDVCRKRVEAVAQFIYRGYEVSFSQIFQSPTKVAVFAQGGDGACVHETDTVEEAIAWINANETGRIMTERGNAR